MGLGIPSLHQHVPGQHKQWDRVDASCPEAYISTEDRGSVPHRGCDSYHR